MMKMSGRVTGCCVALLLFLTSVSAVNKKLKSISNLKNVDFGKSVPKHSLLLLHWFANQVLMDNNNVLWLTFDPDDGDFGSHHYGNYEELLDPLPQGFTYYTVGNLNQETDVPLPPYVVHPRRGYEGRNMDRIVIRVQNGAEWQRIDQVFITQHYGNSRDTEYDPDHTYQITTNLLRQIRAFSLSNNNPHSLSDLINRFGSDADEYAIRNTWGNLACLGLLLFIVIEEKYSSNQHNRRRQNNNGPGRNSRMEDNDRLVHVMMLQVDARENNYTRQNRSSGDFVLDMDDAPRNNYTRKKKRNNNCCKWVIGCVISVIVLILIAVATFLYFYLRKT